LGVNPVDIMDAFASAADLASPDGHISALVALSTQALDRGEIEQALRLTDRAVRLSPNNAHLHILRGTALLKANLPLRAIAHFDQAISAGGSPDGEIGLAYAYLTLGDSRTAADLACSLVGRFACDDFPRIAPVLRRVCQSLGNAGVGWASVTSDGGIVGAVNEALLTKNGHLIVTVASTGRILDRKNAKQLISAASSQTGHDGFLDFAFKPRGWDHSEAIQVAVGGVDLIGSPACAPSPLLIEGFVDRMGDRISGWVALVGAPNASLTIRLVDQQGLATEFEARAGSDQEADKDASMRRHFSIDLAAIGLAASRVEIWGWLPALGIGNQLSGSPLGGEGVREMDRPTMRLKATAGGPAIPNKRPIDIIIPVYDGKAETLACLDSVIATRRLFGDETDGCDIIVINDDSADSDLVAALAALAADGEICLLHNGRNLGFPISVNRGFALHPDRDVVVLNSDTLVFSDWLPRLRAAAYSAPDIATVTPFSNEASILSYPMSLGDNPAPSADGGALLDRLANEVNAGLTVDIPTAVGFCMYIRRDCLDAVGLFDVTFFGRGYGEENDLCMRAFEAGWRNIAAPNIFVSHIGGHSFGASKKMLVVRNTQILNNLHPGYDGMVRDFIAVDPLAAARRNIDAARLRGKGAGPLILLVTLGLAGGVARHVKEAAERYKGRGLKTLILRPATSDGGGRARAQLADPFDDTLCNLVFDLPDEMDTLAGLLTACGIGKIEIHHFLGLDPSIFAIAERLRVPYEVVLHDYSWLCPRINLVDGRGRYCGLPLDPQICERCVAIDGATLDEKISVQDLRRRSAKILSGARRVVGACNDVVDRFGLFAPDAAYEVTPWEEHPPLGRAIGRDPGTRIRVAVIGGIGEQKGYDLLLSCARDAALRDLPIEFVVVGYTSDDLRLFKTGRVFVTGRYEDIEALDLIRDQSCHFAFLPSVSPETWSYTLTLAWKAGLPVLAFDFGAIAERIANAGYGRTIPFSTDERDINAAIVSFDAFLRSDSSETPTEAGALSVVQHEQGGGTLVASIGSSDDSDRASLETLIALQPGLYAFSLSDGTEADASELPVVQISAAAGYAADTKVDFLGKHNPVENWLADAGDVVVVRITGAACSLLVKTIRAPGRQSASVSVECRRLDRIDDAAAAVVPRDGSGILRVQITAHVQNRGDLPFVAPGWAGCVGEHLWVEAFTINPLEGFLPEEIEYKALTGTGFETPWVSGGTMCGTRGTSNPLIGFAIRLRGPAAERYECRYRGAFLGAGVAGPFRNGAACKSAYGRDPLEGIELEIVERTEAVEPDAEEPTETFMPDYEIVYGSY
jgi:GT2 family glycosyltransferase/glycosyltransferase involved in cell wall biosynthesis